MMTQCSCCGANRDDNHYLEFSILCPNCYREITQRLKHDTKVMLEDVASEFEIDIRDAWEVFATEVDVIPDSLKPIEEDE